MSSEYLSFNAELSRISATLPQEKTKAMLEVSQSVDMAKRILLQHKVQGFTATDVIKLADLMIQRETRAGSK